MRAFGRHVRAKLFVLVVAASAVLTPASAHATEPGSISGTVLADGGPALKGIQVTAWTWSSGTWSPSGGGTTDEHGGYTIPGLVPGTYRVEFNDWSRRHYKEYYDNQKYLDVARAVTVADGRDTGEIDASLAPTALISGTVTKGNDLVAPGIEVQAYTWDTSTGYGWWRSIASTTTGPDGTYELPGLDAGSYRLGFRDTMEGVLAAEFWDNALTREAATPIPLTAGQRLRNRDAHLVAASHITGRAIDGAGLPVEGLLVSAYQQEPTYGSWLPVSTTRTSSSGAYDLGRLSAGTYRLGFKHDANAFVEEFWPDAPSSMAASDVEVGPEATVRDRNVVMKRPASISGVVRTSSGTPIVNGYVSVRRWNGSQDAWDFVSVPYSQQSTNASGEYELAGLRPGRYLLSYSGAAGSSGQFMSEYWDNQRGEEDATPIDVVEGQALAGLTTVLEKGSSISGTMRRTDVSPVEGVEVVPYRWIEHRAEWKAADWGAVTDENGQYQLTYLMSGTYRLAVRLDQKVIGWWGGTSLQTAASVVLGPDAAISGKDAVVAVPARTTPGPAPAPTTAPTTPTQPSAPTLTTTPAPTATPTPDVASQLGGVAEGLKASGKPMVGRTVKVKGLVAQLRTRIGYRFQWYAGRAAIRKATRSSLTVTRAMRGKVLNVKVTLSADGARKVVSLKIGKVA